MTVIGNPIALVTGVKDEALGVSTRLFISANPHAILNWHGSGFLNPYVYALRHHT